MLTRTGAFLPIFEIRTRNDKRFIIDTDPVTEDRWFIYEFQPEELGFHPPYSIYYKYVWNVDEPNLIGVSDGPFGKGAVQDALTLTIGWEDDFGNACLQAFGVKAWRSGNGNNALNASIQCRRKKFSTKGQMCPNGTYELYMGFINKPFWACRTCTNSLFKSEYALRQYYGDELYVQPETLVEEGSAKLHHWGGMIRTPKKKRYDTHDGRRFYLPGYEEE
jgi:hypothetical protein